MLEKQDMKEEKGKGKRSSLITPNRYFWLGKETTRRKENSNQAGVLLFIHLDKDGARKSKLQTISSVAVHLEQWNSCAVTIKDQRVFNTVALCFLVVHCKTSVMAHIELHVTSVTQEVLTPSACDRDVSIIGWTANPWNLLISSSTDSPDT